MHATIFLIVAAVEVMAGLSYRPFVAAGVAGLLVCAILLSLNVEGPAQVLGDVSFLALAVGTGLAIADSGEAL